MCGINGTLALTTGTFRITESFISRMREGKVSIAAGYDGEFGVIKIYSEQEREKIEGQLALF